ncbi:hypothetical protein KC335_g130 [Hortaea werneckii]|nr:hypothetical protein KC335_g130 [Hortaea werneckii]
MYLHLATNPLATITAKASATPSPPSQTPSPVSPSRSSSSVSPPQAKSPLSMHKHRRHRSPFVAVGISIPKQCGIPSYSSYCTLTPCEAAREATMASSSCSISQPVHIHNGGAPSQLSAARGDASGWSSRLRSQKRSPRGGVAGQMLSAGKRDRVSS